jgi:hyperpolarization activated cyclic nucleotide-gated potassium channel 1
LKRLLTKGPETLREASQEDSQDSSFKYLAVWQRARVKLRGVVYLFILCLELRLFGTSSNLKDNNNNFKKKLTSLLDKLQHKRKEEEEVKLPALMIHPNSSFKRCWNLYLICLLAYTATIMPYRISFVDDTVSISWFIVDTVIDASFFTDILINFNSAFENLDGTVVSNRRQVALRYLRTWFFLDLLACFPFEAVGNAFTTEDTSSSDSQSNYHNLLRLIKLPRLYRLLRVTRILKLIKQTKDSEFIEKLQDTLQLNTAFVRTISFVMTLLVALHVVGCLWFMMAKLEDFSPDTWVTRADLINSSQEEQYIASIYWAFTTLSTVGYGDITPKTVPERVFSIMWMMAGIGFNSFMIGTLTSYLANFNSSNKDLAVKLSAIEQLAKDTKLRPSLTRKLRAAVKMHAKKAELGTVDKQAMFESLPKKLRYQIAKNMYESAADRIPFFKGRSPEFISSTIPSLRFSYMEAQDLIYREDDDSDEVYFLYKGRVDFILNIRSIPFKTMLEGSYFGDIEVFFKTKRFNSCRAQTDCELLVMPRSVSPRQQIKVIAEDFPEVYEEMRELALKRKEKIVEARDEVKDALLITVNRGQKLKRARLKLSTLKLLTVSKTESVSF